MAEDDWKKIEKTAVQQDRSTDGLQDPPTNLSAERETRVTQDHPASEEERHRATERDYWREQSSFARVLNWITGVTAAIGAVGLVGLYCTFVETRVANEIDREAMRAFLIPDRRGDDTVSVLPRNRGFNIRLRNSGQTAVKAYVVQSWPIIHTSGSITSIEAPPSILPSRSVAPGDVIPEPKEWDSAYHDFDHVVGSRKGMGMVWRITYRDSFDRDHCEQFAVTYWAPDTLDPPTTASFSGVVPSVCNTDVRSVRLTFVCVSDGDFTPPHWRDNWEWFSENAPQSDLPKSNETPCYEQRPKQNPRASSILALGEDP